MSIEPRMKKDSILVLWINSEKKKRIKILSNLKNCSMSELARSALDFILNLNKELIDGKLEDQEAIKAIHKDRIEQKANAF